MDDVWDVAIVGGGPVGVFAATLLARSGHSVCVIEREPVPHGLPRAVHIDHEIVRLMGDIGVLDDLMPLMRVGDGHIHIGADGGVIRFMSAADQPRPFGHANDYFFYQPEMEAILRAALGRHDQARLMLGHSVEAIRPEGDRVHLDLGGRNLSARWVIGCDGARSAVRKAMGIGLDDLAFDEPWLVVDAEVRGPVDFPDFDGVPKGADLQNLSLMLCDPGRPATVVPGRGDHRRWEFMLLPGEDESEVAEPGNVRSLVAPWIGDSPHEITRAATYRFHGLVADRWREGRVFLAGDAAHQTPPFFGQGLCHGFRDAANLAWKLDLVLRDVADPALLDTYQTERDAQVRHVIGRAIEAGRYICELDPVKAAERDRRIRSEAGIRSAGELIAPISSPIVAEGAGERFLNPVIEDGRLLDNVTGGGWRLFHRGPEPRHHVLHALNARPVPISDLPDAEGHMARWFDGVACALVRPDHYLAAHAPDAGAFRDTLDRLALADHLHLTDLSV